MTATEELFLPEPLPREVKYTVISVDDHVVEPPHTFEGRLPAHLQDRAPCPPTRTVCRSGNSRTRSSPRWA